MKYISNITRTLLSVALAAISIGASAQQSSSLYFMNNVPERNAYNPAFQPIHNVYIDIPVMPNFRVDVDEPFILNDLLKQRGDSLYSILHPSLQGERDKFFKNLSKVEAIRADATLNLIGFGFRFREKNYITFGTAVKLSGGLYLPKDLFRLPLYGTKLYGDMFDWGSLGANVSAYLEASIGYSRKINEQWTVGGNLKYLMGFANLSTKVSRLQLSTSIEQWKVDAGGAVNASFPGLRLPQKPDGSLALDSASSIGYNLEVNSIIQQLLHNPGFGIDLGATYSPIPSLQLSAALTDLGFIHWGQGVQNVSLDESFSFDGIDYTLGDDVKNLFASLADSVKSKFNNKVGAKSYNTWLTARANVGAEYNINNTIGFGLLSTTVFDTKLYTDLTASFNLRPTTWISWAFTYSLLRGRWSTLGVGLQLRLAPFNMYLTVDRIPLRWASVRHGEDLGISMGKLPTRWSGTSLQAGMVWVFGDPKRVGDDDKDGVKNRRDRCPNTIPGDVVDEYGCARDEDGDGVADNKDSCPGTPVGIPVDMQGCPYDEDKDGVPNYRDICPATPAGAKVDSMGCPLDSDRDGVIDLYDKCDSTPVGVQVDSAGCPNDDDKDGVPNHLDLCPNTPPEARASIDANGCPIDSDKDGVPDYRDSCPNTPAGTEVDFNGCKRNHDMDGDGVLDENDRCPGTPEAARGQIDEHGCPYDTDGDGVPDYRDLCPGTPAEVKGLVDINGCPLDSDGDSIPDYVDNCPNIKGVAENYGCPPIKAAAKQLFEKALNGIQFQSGKDVILKTSNSILDAIAQVMKDNPDYILMINGHTDNVGKPEKNLDLSMRRAASVKRYLVKVGVPAERMITNGFGDTKPIDTNATAAGRAKNRRVEMVVKFEK